MRSRGGQLLILQGIRFEFDLIDNAAQLLLVTVKHECMTIQVRFTSVFVFKSTLKTHLIPQIESQAFRSGSSQRLFKAFFFFP